MDNEYRPLTVDDIFEADDEFTVPGTKGWMPVGVVAFSLVGKKTDACPDFAKFDWRRTSNKYKDLSNSDFFEDGDQWFNMGSYSWCYIDPKWVGSQVGSFFPLTRCRRLLIAPPPKISIWHCNSATCRNRENDVGHVCFWCGSPQSSQNKKKEKSND